MKKLMLAEELLLLALNDEKGNVVASGNAAVHFGLAGAVIAELVLEERITADEKKNLVINNPELTGDEILDDAMKLFTAAKKPKKLQQWVMLLHQKLKLQNRFSNRLVEKGILKEEEHKFLWVIPYSRYPMINGFNEETLRSRIRNVVLGGNAPDIRTAILISLVHSCKLTNEIFAKNERKAAAKTIKELVKGEMINKAVSDAIGAASAAVSAAIAGAAAASIAATS